MSEQLDLAGSGMENYAPGMIDFIAYDVKNGNAVLVIKTGSFKFFAKVIGVDGTASGPWYDCPASDLVELDGGIVDALFGGEAVFPLDLTNSVVDTFYSHAIDFIAFDVMNGYTVVATSYSHPILTAYRLGWDGKLSHPYHLHADALIPLNEVTVDALFTGRDDAPVDADDDAESSFTALKFLCDPEEVKFGPPEPTFNLEQMLHCGEVAFAGYLEAVGENASAIGVLAFRELMRQEAQRQ